MTGNDFQVLHSHGNMWRFTVTATQTLYKHDACDSPASFVLHLGSLSFSKPHVTANAVIGMMASKCYIQNLLTNPHLHVNVGGLVCLCMMLMDSAQDDTCVSQQTRRCCCA